MMRFAGSVGHIYSIGLSSDIPFSFSLNATMSPSRKVSRSPSMESFTSPDARLAETRVFTRESSSRGKRSSLVRRLGLFNSPKETTDPVIPSVLVRRGTPVNYCCCGGARKPRWRRIFIRLTNHALSLHADAVR